MSGAGLAVAVALLATTAYHLGLILEKRALARLPAIDARHAASLLRILLTAPAWLAGFCLMLCGFGLQVVALTLAPVSVVQPVLGSGVVILLVLSRIVLRETLGRLELGCVLAMAGAIVVIALSATGSAGHVGHQTSGLLLAAVAVPAILVALGLGASALRPDPAGRHRAPANGVSYAVASGLLYGVATLAIKGLSGTIAHHGALSARLLLAVAGSPYPYVTVGCSAIGMLIFQTGLQRCRVSIVGPVSNISGSVFFIVAGTWLFGERLPADPGKLALRLAGILVAGVVVVTLSRRPATAEADVRPATAAVPTRTAQPAVPTWPAGSAESAGQAAAPGSADGSATVAGAA
jgi:drug/metabolite transporter (DMT)-like permease